MLCSLKVHLFHTSFVRLCPSHATHNTTEHQHALNDNTTVNCRTIVVLYSLSVGFSLLKSLYICLTLYVPTRVELFSCTDWSFNLLYHQQVTLCISGVMHWFYCNASGGMPAHITALWFALTSSMYTGSWQRTRNSQKWELAAFALASSSSTGYLSCTQYGCHLAMEYVRKGCTVGKPSRYSRTWEYCYMSHTQRTFNASVMAAVNLWRIQTASILRLVFSQLHRTAASAYSPATL